MKKLLVIGDLIRDRYWFGHATRICPEAPVPVIIPFGKSLTQRVSDGGARLVANQIRELLSDSAVVDECYGTISDKLRIYADKQMVCRLDRDAWHKVDVAFYGKQIVQKLVANGIDDYNALVVSDYGKGSFSAQTAHQIIKAARSTDTRVFVDAKRDWKNWWGAYAFFPNREELKTEELNGDFSDEPEHIIRKLDEDGCEVDGKRVPLETHPEVVDVCGAGDVFLAAFVAHFVTFRQNWAGLENFSGKHYLQAAARYANEIAGKSVEHIGTYVVQDSFLKREEEDGIGDPKV